MITYQDTWDIISKLQFKRKSEQVPVHKSVGYYLSSDITALSDSPPFDRSAMDGFAVCGEVKEGAVFDVVDTILAGDSREITPLINKTCCRIMTGAPVPRGTDCVVPFENSKVYEDAVTGEQKAEVVVVPRTTSIAKKGENSRFGSLLFKQGTKITPAVVCALLSSGYSEVPVYIKPCVSVLCTGSELVSAGKKLKMGQIYDSNSVFLNLFLGEMGICIKRVSRVGDSLYKITQAIKKSLKDSDLILLTGGVSEGDSDFVPKAVKKMGGQEIFHRIAIKPGKPTFFASVENRKLGKDQFIFGLPGNPVSTQVISRLILKPFLEFFCGAVPTGNSFYHQLPTASYKLKYSMKRKNGERLEFFPAVIDKSGIGVAYDMVELVEGYKGSGDPTGFSKAEVLIPMKRGELELEKGTAVDVIFL